MAPNPGSLISSDPELHVEHYQCMVYRRGSIKYGVVWAQNGLGSLKLTCPGCHAGDVAAFGVKEPCSFSTLVARRSVGHVVDG